MAKFTVHLNAYASTSYEVEADSPEEAYQIVMEEKASLSDVSGSDWDIEYPGEIACEDGSSIDINDLEEEYPDDDPNGIIGDLTSGGSS